jgi:hypothetical protein
MRSETDSNLIHSLLLVRSYTRARFDLWMLAGQSNGKYRAAVLGALTGAKVPQSKAGVNAVSDALLSALGIPSNECAAVREEYFRQVADYLTTAACTNGAQVFPPVSEPINAWAVNHG